MVRDVTNTRASSSLSYPHNGVAGVGLSGALLCMYMYVCASFSSHPSHAWDELICFFRFGYSQSGGNFELKKAPGDVRLIRAVRAGRIVGRGPLLPGLSPLRAFRRKGKKKKKMSGRDLLLAVTNGFIARKSRSFTLVPYFTIHIYCVKKQKQYMKRELIKVNFMCVYVRLFSSNKCF